MSGPAPAHQPGPLAGLAVLELGDGVAGAAAADILAALGAAVTTVTSADSLLRALQPQAGGTSVLAAVLDARKHAVGSDGGSRAARRRGHRDLRPGPPQRHRASGPSG